MLNYARGFKPLQPGRIHLMCPKCGRKQSNMPRCEFDPQSAFLVSIECPKCNAGDFGGAAYFDRDGNEVPHD
jgi:hypothetical protein